MIFFILSFLYGFSFYCGSMQYAQIINVSLHEHDKFISVISPCPTVSECQNADSQNKPTLIYKNELILTSYSSFFSLFSDNRYSRYAKCCHDLL